MHRLSMPHVFSFILWVKSCPAFSQCRRDQEPAWRPLTCLLLYEARSAIRPLLLCGLLFEGCFRDSSIGALGFTEQLGGKRRRRWGEASGPSPELSRVSQEDWTSSVKALIKDHFQAPLSGPHFHACCDQTAVALPWILLRARAGFSNQAWNRLLAGLALCNDSESHVLQNNW